MIFKENFREVKKLIGFEKNYINFCRFYELPFSLPKEIDRNILEELFEVNSLDINNLDVYKINDYSYDFNKLNQLKEKTINYEEFEKKVNNINKNKNQER